ncbi:DUF885 family protein [Kordiimonas sp. SCSIO 12610]|uniref:DUF885 domain-containing protein n=1 Tax=Kordiimonas sp. SCSIO 12610 TaxID=2829597 RepID=UPI0021098065|nr:DUF885 domain-containing protein [Kordiimonas sp. SCSIO 12610]UTW55989.1 DUF885 domain-containing protein [Kordiimonas sp. SCSIO 12610]
MKHLLIALMASTALVACGDSNTAPNSEQTQNQTSAAPSAEDIQAETARINAWFEEQFEQEVAFSPIQQTILGRKTNNDKMDDFTNAAQDKQLDWKRQSVAEMKANFDYNKLSDDAKTSWDIWEYQLNTSEAADKFRKNGYTFNQMTAIQGFFPRFLISLHRVDEAADMEGYISRISESARALRQLIDISKENAAAGTRPPKFSFELVIDGAQKIITGAPFTDGDDSAIWTDAQAKVKTLLDAEKIDQAQADTFLGAARTALLNDWQPAYEALIAWQKEDMANTAEVAAGVGALPNGADFYNERLANNTTTNLTADEIHEIGLSEVARLRAEMIAVKEQVGFEGDLQAFFKELRDNKEDRRYYFPNTDEGRQGYIDGATSAIDGIKSKLPDYFGILPKADLVVKRVEAFREQPGAAQHYFPSTPDGSRPGVYYAHLSDMTAMPKRELEVIAYHEGLPGHHMQIAIQQELESVPTFRTQAGFTAYSEGWGLYSELLAKEMEGTYADPYSEFGRLGSEIWRAIRLVLDTGLHSKGWTEDQAVDYFKANSAITEAQARSEVRRYMVLPGQATSYKIGMLKIIELRKKAEAALGDQFDIKGFHDTVLGGGAVPLTILERRIDQWVESVKAG